MCILLTYHYKSKAIGAYIVLIHNESDTNVTKEIYLNMSICCESETCLTGLSSGNYTLYIYDLESQSGPVVNDNKVPAVILTSLEVPVTIPTTTTKAIDIIRSTSTNTLQYTETSIVSSSILTVVPGKRNKGLLNVFLINLNCFLCFILFLYSLILLFNIIIIIYNYFHFFLLGFNKSNLSLHKMFTMAKQLLVLVVVDYE